MTGRVVDINIIRINAGSGYALTSDGEGVCIPAKFAQQLSKECDRGSLLRVAIIPRAGGGEIAPFEVSGIPEELPPAATSAA